ncbi:hypothetical protein NKJ23_20945 [Mesorhizobium sp. M0184]|uniref:hypothetical protein n=1 Tax=Mesorhizobium sp. M0184 TaxID=2956906 RepID=UPI00333C4655
MIWETLWSWIDPLAKAIGAIIGAIVVAGGGTAAIAFLIFRGLGESWLNSKFEKRMAAFTHEQDKQIERLRFRINALFDRTTKLHEREFDVVPETWARLIDAYNEVAGFVHFFQQYPNLDKMSDAQLEEFLESSPLQKWQKDELRSTEKKVNYYQKAIFWVRLGTCQEKYRDFRKFLRKNAIFMLPSMKEKFEAMDGLMWAALVEREFNEEDHGVPKERAAKKKFDSECPDLLRVLEQEIQVRLWSTNLSIEEGSPVDQATR